MSSQSRLKHYQYQLNYTFYRSIRSSFHPRMRYFWPSYITWEMSQYNHKTAKHHHDLSCFSFSDQLLINLAQVKYLVTTSQTSHDHITWPTLTNQPPRHDWPRWNNKLGVIEDEKKWHKDTHTIDERLLDPMTILKQDFGYPVSRIPRVHVTVTAFPIWILDPKWKQTLLHRTLPSDLLQSKSSAIFTFWKTAQHIQKWWVEWTSDGIRLPRWNRCWSRFFAIPGELEMWERRRYYDSRVVGRAWRVGGCEAGHWRQGGNNDTAPLSRRWRGTNGGKQIIQLRLIIRNLKPHRLCVWLNRPLDNVHGVKTNIIL